MMEDKLPKDKQTFYSMKDKLHIAFVWFWDRASEIIPNWRDGLRAAIEIIAKDHDVEWFLDCKIPSPKDDWDFILFWGDSNCPFFDVINQYPCRRGICLSTSPTNIDNLKKVDVVYCESLPVQEEARMHGLRTIRAFGTDTNFFSPDKFVDKDIEYFYPATFSPWKRQSSIANLGKRLTCIGTVQPDGEKELKACLDNGVNVEIGYFPPEKIRDYYRRARKVIIPAIHGSERTALEAMSCNILPQVNPDNIKTSSYLTEYRRAQSFDPRFFALEYYSEKKYAADLLRGMYGI